MSLSIVASLSSDIGRSPLLYTLVSGYLAILLHELGHAAVALREPGDDPVTIQIGTGPRLLKFQRGRVELRVFAIPLAGRVLWNPPVMRVGTYRRFVSAGPWASLAAGLAFGLIALAAKDSGAGPTYSLCVGLAVDNIFVGLLNAVPFTWRGGTRSSDGYKRRALERLKLPDDGTVWDRTVVAEAPTVAEAPVVVAAPVLAEAPPVASTSVAPPGYRAAA